MYELSDADTYNLRLEIAKARGYDYYDMAPNWPESFDASLELIIDILTTHFISITHTEEGWIFTGMTRSCIVDKEIAGDFDICVVTDSIAKSVSIAWLDWFNMDLQKQCLHLS